MLFNSFSGLEALLSFLDSPAGAVLFVPIYVIWVTLLLPGIWMTLLAGVLYGPWLGSTLVFIGACIGAEISFLLGRTFLRDWVQNKISSFPKFQAVEKAVSREGLKLILMSRLSPAFPFGLLNFVYGLSQVRFIDYSIGLIAILPATILFCVVGATVGDFAGLNEVATGQIGQRFYFLRFIGLFATAASLWIVGRAAKKALQDPDL